MTVDLKAIATDLRAQADALDPPLTPTPAPAPQPVGSFIGRSIPDPNIFNPAPLVAEDFAAVVAEGQMFDQTGKGLGSYANWNAYPPNYASTDKSGYYDPGRASVVQTKEGGTAAQLRLVSAKSNPSRGKPSGVCIQAAPNGSTLQTIGEKVEMRTCLLVPGPGGHYVPLGWPPNDHDWPVNGEPDYLEIDTNAGATVGGFLHVQNGGSNGQGQIKLTSSIPATSWFTVGHERIPGVSYKWTVNGQVTKEIHHGDASLPAPYDIPLHALRWPIQFETKGTSQTNDVIVLIDWWTIWQMK